MTGASPNRTLTAPRGEQFCLTYDSKSFIYISKAIDLFDVTEPYLVELGLSPLRTQLPLLDKGLCRLQHTPIFILGAQSDILFPVDQQRELADALRMAGNSHVIYYELGGVLGNDTFLLDVQNVGSTIKPSQENWKQVRRSLTLRQQDGDVKAARSQV